MKKTGTITVISGPMFSGKSEDLLARLKRATYAKKTVLVVKPKKDLRAVDEIVSRRLREEEKKFQKYSSMPAHTVSDKDELMALENSGCHVLGVDEVQFFSEWFVEVVKYLAWEKGINVIASGLDLDAWRNPFGIMPQLIAISDIAPKLNAICFKCGNEARFTQKLSGSKAQIEIGDADKYEARCGDCYEKFEGQ